MPGAEGRRVSTCVPSCLPPRRFSAFARPAGDLLGHCLAGRLCFISGVRPVTLWISTSYARAVPGAPAAAKCGGNYASSLAGQARGCGHGCDQAVFLDSSTHTYIEELGRMNLFFVTKDGEIVAPEAAGTIPRGRHPDVDPPRRLGDSTSSPRSGASPSTEVEGGAAAGDIVEIFACGTFLPSSTGR